VDPAAAALTRAAGTAEHPLQFLIWFRLLDFPATPANLVGFGLFAILLVEGASYWIAKFRQPAGAPLPAAGVFAAARRGNVVLLAAGLLFVLWPAMRDPGAGNLLGLGFVLMAVLEQVNYFHVQLMYDTPEDLRHLRTHGLVRSHLSRDLARQ
jgi:Ca2+/Na+ antiporter